MRYNVAQLLKEPIGSSRSYQLDENFAGPHRHADSVSGPVYMVRVHNGILVRATVEVRSHLICSRCLGEFPRASQLTVEEEFFPTLDPQSNRDPQSGRKMPLPDESEEAEFIDSNHVLDLTSLTNEYIITDMPMKPLCKTNCKGLCHLCGVNQNLESCNCASQTMDPRWQALADLVPKE